MIILAWSLSSLLLRQLFYANTNLEYGYDVLDGFDINLDHINQYEVKQNDEIILASDGYPILKNSLAASEEALSNIINTDRFCYKTFKSTKGVSLGNNSFDDRTFIRFIDV